MRSRWKGNGGVREEYNAARWVETIVNGYDAHREKAGCIVALRAPGGDGAIYVRPGCGAGKR